MGLLYADIVANMDLFTLGLTPRGQNDASWEDNSTPRSIVRADAGLWVHWVSWCDLVYTFKDATGASVLKYVGISLTPAQQEHLVQDECVQSFLNPGLPGVPKTRCTFLGGQMHDGLRGYCISHDECKVNYIVVFSLDTEIQAGAPHVKVYHGEIGTNMVVSKLLVLSGSDFLVEQYSMKTGSRHISHGSELASILSKTDDKISCASISTSVLVTTDLIQVVNNATTATVLDAESGVVRTWCRDSRHPRCLGRELMATNDFQIIPYLSETKIKMIASGGYMTAALSIDGELYLWGQACPGSEGELLVLRTDDTIANVPMGPNEHGVYVEGEQEDFVKCLSVRIHGQEASVYSVALGHGHILVAAKVQKSDGTEDRAVFAAGDNSHGQLGLSLADQYVKDFKEVESLTGRNIRQMSAAGWSSMLIVGP